MRLAPNFTLAELAPHGLPTDPTERDRVLANLRDVAVWLQAARDAGGAPLRVTSGYRSPARNAAVGGSPTSDHVRGLAADFVPVGISLDAWWARVREQLLPFDQVILYPYTKGHVHVGLGPRTRGQILVNTVGDGYEDASSWWAKVSTTVEAAVRSPAGGASASVLLWVAVVGLLLWVL